MDNVKINLLYSGNDKFSYFCDKNDVIDSYLSKAGLEKIEEEELKKVNKDKSFPFWVAEYSPRDFSGGQRRGKSKEFPFGQNLLRGNVNNDEQIPIIHIVPPVNSLADFLFGDKRLDNRIPRLFPIMDSSIWNYMVFSDDIKVKREGKETLKKERNVELFRTIKQIYQNYKHKLYNLSVAREYADLNARLANESYLCGDHSDGVAPIIFHSEYAVEDMINQEFKIERETIKKLTNRCWRILLVDDKAQAPMRTKDDVDPNKPPKPIPPQTEDNKDFCLNSKMQIILRLIAEGLKINEDEVDYRKHDGSFAPLSGDYIENKKINNNKKILIEYAESKKDAFDALKERKYDIVLLDYLLENRKKEHEYGYELLNDIYKDHDVTKKCECMYGPNGRIFFMFISAYSSAVHERLLAEGLNQIEDYWQIAIGACPTNTPQLFLYNLIKLMEYRLDMSGINKISTQKIYELVESIYNPQEGFVRKHANNKYEEILSLQYHYRKMLKDVDIPNGGSVFDSKGSVLITDFIRKNLNLGGMLEHLTQLVHLTAFGTIRQWPEMWEEFLYFKGQFKAQNDIAGVEAVSDKAYKEMMIHIEDYIKTLKTQ